MLACVAGGISRASDFVLVEKPWTRVANPWEDWWRVELNSRLPKCVRFFELCVQQCTRISDWLRVLKRQSNVNRYLSSFPGEKVCFHTPIRKMEKAKKYIEEALDSPNIRRESMTHLPFSVRSLDLFLSLHSRSWRLFMFCYKEECQVELSRKIVLWQIFISHRSPWFPLSLSACRLAEFDTVVICHVFIRGTNMK